jgi:prepilin-type processing-associated H-X9-DG protein
MLTVLALKTLASGLMETHSAICLNNLRRLTLSWQLFAEDNSGRLVGNLDGGAVSTLSNSNRTWVLGWIDSSGMTLSSGFPVAYGGRGNTNTFVLTQLSPLAPYHERSADVFKCPADPGLGNGTSGAPVARSYSMNSYMGPGSSTWTSGYRRYSAQQDLLDPVPSRAFLFLDERADGINDGCLFVDMIGYDPMQPSRRQIIDFPAMYHDRSANFSFADGHVESRRWTDPRTTPTQRLGIQLIVGVASPNNADVLWIQERTSRRTLSR